MYFNNIDIINIDDFLNSSYKFYAHIKKCEQNKKTLKKELLKSHAELCLKYFNKIFISKNLEKIFINFEKYYLKNMSNEGIKLFREILINILGFHDMGKINPHFQIRNMDNKIKEDVDYFSQLTTQHSIISAVLYIDYYLNKILSLNNKSEKKKLRNILFINGYIISKHHGNLNEFIEFLDSFDEGKSAFKVIEIFKNHYKNIYLGKFYLSHEKAEKQCGFVLKNIKTVNEEESIYLYTYSKLMFSLLVACDYYATTEFMNDVEISSFGDISEISEIYDVYKNTDVYKSIRKYEREKYNNVDKDFKYEKNINILRNEMFLDAEKEIIKKKDKNIFFLEAPTGSGKSNVAMNLSFKLMEENSSLKKIIDVYPFNTLVEQNLESLYKTFGKKEDVFDKIAVVNSIYPIKINDEDELDYSNYTKALLNRQFLNYPILLTTHVSLFNTMFGSTKESSFGFHQLAHSVVVLDEIQSYKNIIWSEIISFLNGFARILDMKVIIMSATLPDLESLLVTRSKNDYSANLILDRDKYFTNPLFKNRVLVNYDLIDTTNSLESLYNHVIESSKSKKKILIEFIKKQSAYDFYNKLKEVFEDNSECTILELMTGDDNIIERKRILEVVESEEAERNGMILISTQVIEAGVDIDMDIGYKDISKLDSDEQFMGRINRSCRKSGKVYFFNLDKADLIYKEDLRVNKDLSLLNEKMRGVLVNKNFFDYYEPVLNHIKKNYNETFNESNLSDFFVRVVGSLNFIEIEKRMKLINDNNWNMSVYLGRVITKEEHGKNIKIDGNDIWEQYKKLLMDNSLDYAEKQVKLSKVRSLMNYFIYEIKKNANLSYNDRIGELYYIENGEKYFDNEKLNKEKFVSEVGLFLDL